MVYDVSAGSTRNLIPGFAFLFVLFAPDGAAPAMAQPHTDAPKSGAWLSVDLAAADSDSPVRVLAQNLHDKTPSAGAVGRHQNGVGAAGAQASAPAIRAETGFDPISGGSEHLFILVGRDVTQAEMLLTYFFPDEVELGGISYHEQGAWRAYRGARLVDQGTFISNAMDGNFRLSVVTQAPFDRLEFFAGPYVNASGAEIAPGRVLTDSSDFLIKQIAYQAPPDTPARAPSAAGTAGGADAAGDKSKDSARSHAAAD